MVNGSVNPAPSTRTRLRAWSRAPIARTGKPPTGTRPAARTTAAVRPGRERRGQGSFAAITRAAARARSHVSLRQAACAGWMVQCVKRARACRICLLAICASFFHPRLLAWQLLPSGTTGHTPACNSMPCAAPPPIPARCLTVPTCEPGSGVADDGSCAPCGDGQVSAGGENASCGFCPEGQTANADQSACDGGGGAC